MTAHHPPLAEPLAEQLRGRVVGPADPSYDEARKVYNAMIDRRPAAIAYCFDVADVIQAVNFARERGLLAAIRGGAHNGAGLGTCDDGLVIDMSGMKGIHVDPDARTVRAEAGCLLGDVDHATHAFGLAVPAGFISTTGVAGLTLGGGIGHLTRKLGLTIDNLLEATVVLASGDYVTANESSHPDLFWALRGGGGNFGVATSLKFRLHPVHTVHCGPTFWDLDRADEVLRWYREFLPSAPEDLGGWFAFLTVPPAPPFPEELHGRMVCGVVWCYTGDDAERDFAPVKAMEPMLYGLHDAPYPAFQSAFDQFYPHGHQWYWKADFFREIPDEAVHKHVEFGSRMPSPQSTMHLYPIDGAAHRIGRRDTAWSYRDATFAQVIVGVDPEPAKKEELMAWTRDYHDALHPHSAGGAYINMIMDEGEERVRESYRDNYNRLARIKAKYDPDNFFRVNQNIKPLASDGRSEAVSGRADAASDTRPDAS